MLRLPQLLPMLLMCPYYIQAGAAAEPDVQMDSDEEGSSVVCVLVGLSNPILMRMPSSCVCFSKGTW